MTGPLGDGRRVHPAAGVAGGVFATVTMDAAMVLAARLAPDAFASDKISPEMIGRWAAGLARGRWRHEDVSAETPVRGELWIGLAAHYLTGVTLTQVYLAAAGRGGRRPGVSAAHANRVGHGRTAAPPHVPLDGLRVLRPAERRRSSHRARDVPRARRVRCRHRRLEGYQTNGMNCRRTSRRWSA